MGREAGTPIYYGDAASTSVLEWVGGHRARAIVFAISDPGATRSAVAAARSINPNAWILARTRYTPEIEPLYAAGATVVITEEFETSLTILRRLLAHLGVHPSKIDRAVLGIRQQRYEPLLAANPPILEVDSAIRMFETRARRVSNGQSIGSLEIRKRSGATIVAVERNGTVVTNPPPDWILHEGDRIHLIGSEEEVGTAITLI